MKLFRKWTAALLIIALSVSLAVPALADGSESRQHRISFGNNYVEFRDIDILPHGKENMLLFTLYVYNGNSSTLSFNDYFLKVRSKSGQAFTLKRLDTETNTIPARSGKEYRYYANTRSVSSISDLQFTLIRWDFSQPNYERTIGQIVIPQTSFTPLPTPQGGQFDIDHIRTEGKVDRMRVRENDDEAKVTIDMRMNNISSHSIAFPQLDFQLVTANGLHYPLTIVKQDPEDMLRPNEEVELELEGTLPLNTNLQKAVLLITRPLQTKEGATLNETIARFALPAAEPFRTVPLGEEETYKNDDGTYKIALTQLYRLPWDDDDMLTADFRITNADQKTLPIPDLVGHFKLDKNIEVPAQTIMTDRSIALQPGESVTVHLTGKIPYTYSFSELEIVLQEKETTANGERFHDVFDFVHSGEYSAVVHINEGESFRLEKAGRRYDVSVNDVTRFESTTSDYFSITLAFENKEKRLSDIPELTAQLELADGAVYPLTLTKPIEKTAPGGIALVELGTAIPKRTDTSNAKLLLGEAFAQGAPAQPEQPVEGYVSPVAFAVKESAAEVKEDLENISLAPYTLSITKVNTPHLYFNEVTFKFDYKLEKDLLVEANRDQHRFRIELEDRNGKVWMEREFALENPAEPGQLYFELGSDTIKIVEQFDTVSFDLNRFTVNVYHQIGTNHKKLLAKKEFNWQGSMGR